MRALAPLALAALLSGAYARAAAPNVSGPVAGEDVFASKSYREALERARARGVVLFVDAWAPWCHTCLFFRERVAPEIDRDRVAPFAEFVAVDTEAEGGAAFLAKHPMTEWPTFFLMDPRSEEVRWMSTKLLAAREVEEVVRREGERFANELARRRAASAGVIARASANRSRGDFVGAARILEEELAHRENRAHHADVLATLVSVAFAAKDDARCLDALVRVAGDLGAAERVPALALGLACAEREAKRRPDDARALLALAEVSVREPSLLGDDRSSLFEALVSLAKALGDDARARTIAGAWLDFLEHEASMAPTPAARSVYDAHRAAAAVALGEPARAIEAVELSARERPWDGNTQLRLAVLLRELGRVAEAHEHVNVALELLHGPRRVRAFEVRASIAEREGALEAQADALVDALAEARALVGGPRGDALARRLAGEIARARTAALRARVAKGELPSIVQAGDPVLRMPAVDVPKELLGTAELEALVATMVAVMRKAPGVGLAAPQLGVPWRLFVFEDTEERMAKLTSAERVARGRTVHPLTVMVNPVVALDEGPAELFFEGCLSVSGYTAAVARSPALEVSGLDAAGKPLTLKLRGWPARIVQHEFDHVEGVLYVDRMNTRSLASGENAKRFVQGKPTARALGALGADGAPASGARGAPDPLRRVDDRRSVRRP